MWLTDPAVTGLGEMIFSRAIFSWIVRLEILVTETL
jgi:hypothetical protein